MVPTGQAVMLDEDTANLHALIIEGELVWDDTKDLKMTSAYIWVKGGTFELGTEERPFKKQALITLTGNKYTAVRLPVVGAKCLAVSNTQFTIRDGGDGAVEEGNIGTLDIHGAPRLKVWTRLSKTADAGSNVIVLQDIVDYKPGEELMVAATEASHKHFSGNGLFGAPPVDFHNERVFVESIAADMKTITLTQPLKWTHISTSYTRPDGEYVDLSAEVALLSRNVKIQGDNTSDEDSWGGHTMVAFGGVYRLADAEFYRMGQQGELSRYPIHFHVSQQWGRLCYAKRNSIHYSYQRAVAIHGTDYTLTQGNVGFEIIGHMFFVETGMEKYNVIEGNLGVGAIPLLSGMLESDQEPSGFWTAAPNNVWRDNVAVTGSDGWYFQLPGNPISQNMDIYKNSICPVGDRLGEWRNNRCHHTTGSCVRIYMVWKPTKDPCNEFSGENPAILYNTTCWGIGKYCFNSLIMGSVHFHHLTSIESHGADYTSVRMQRGGSYNGAFWPLHHTGIPHIKDSVFVGLLPENYEKKEVTSEYSIGMPQEEQFTVEDSWWVNWKKTVIFKDCLKCWGPSKWRQGASTYHFRGLSFTNVSKRIYVHKKGIYHDIDGSLVGTADSYTTWADKFNLKNPACTATEGVKGHSCGDEWQEGALVKSSTGAQSYFGGFGGEDSGSIFKVMQGKALVHSRRDWCFITCTKPIRKFEIAYPEPAEVYLRQLNITNLDTGLTHVYEFEDKEIFGWAFPLVADTRISVRPNLIGLDLRQASIRYGFLDAMELMKSEAMKNKELVTPEWAQLVVQSWSKWDHYKMRNPDWELLATRYGTLAGEAAKDYQTYLEPLLDPAVLNKPSGLKAMSHGMLDPTAWSVTFRYPTDILPVEKEPLSARFEARRCPDEGCGGVPAEINMTWDSYILWSDVIGETTAEDGVVIDAEDWVMFDMPGTVVTKNITIFGKLSFDDAASRKLITEHIVVWGMLEIGTKEKPFGQTSGANVTIRLDGKANQVESYVYIEEETLHSKLVAVPGGRVETYGADFGPGWSRLAEPLAAGATSACLQELPGNAQLLWKKGHMISIAPTEFDRPDMRYDRGDGAAGDVEIRRLVADATFDSTKKCWIVSWDTGDPDNLDDDLKFPRVAQRFNVSSTQSMDLRAVVGMTSRSIIFEAKDRDGDNYYGGHFEIFDIATGNIQRVGSVSMRNTQFNEMGKGGLSAAIKIGYSANYDPPPVNVFEGCSWTFSYDYGLHAASKSSPVVIKDNVFSKSHNGGIYTDVGATGVQIVHNAVIGVSMSPNAPTTTNELSGNFRVINFAGIRCDEHPVRMLENVVAASNDIGFLHMAQPCSSPTILDNEAVANIVGVFLLPLPGKCQTANFYKVWKSAHIAVFLADITAPSTQLSKLMIADSHIGIAPYYSTGSRFRRMWIRDSVIVGSSPSSVCHMSNFCRAQHIHDPFMAGCNSIFAPGGFRRIGYLAPFNTGNKKTCKTSMDPRLCRLLSPAYPNLDGCHFPWEYHNHFDRGLGWTFFERVTFAFFKDNDCDRISRALSMGVSGAEINFPARFTEVTWYNTDVKARYELSAEVLDSSLVGRKSPCKFDSGGCMGLDQLLFQDYDGSFLGLPDGIPGTVIPYTPRTEIVWSSQCSNSVDELYGGTSGVTLDALICPNVTVQLVEMRNLDRGAADVKFGPWALTPDKDEDNGFDGGVISSTGPFYAVCPCGWDFSFYHALIKPATTYYAEVISMPENFMLRYWSEKPEDAILLQFFYPDSRGVNVFVGGAKEPDMALRLGRPPTLADPHGSHVVDSQGLRLHVTLRGSPQGFNSARDLVIRRTPTVKLKMNVEISISEFNGEGFQTNLAILLGIPPERIKVADVKVRRRLSFVTSEAEDDELVSEDSCGWKGNIWRNCGISNGRRLARRLAAGLALEVNIEPSQDVAAASSGGNKDSASMESMNAQASELNSLSQSLGAVDAKSFAAAAGGEVTVTEMQAPSEQDSTQVEEEVDEADTAPPAVVNSAELAEQQATAASADVSKQPCPVAIGDVVTVGGISQAVYPASELESGKSATVTCSSVNSGFENDITLTCAQGVLKASASACRPKSCSAGVSVTIGSATATVTPSTTLVSGTSASQGCSNVHASYAGDLRLTCSMGTLTVDTTACQPGCLSSAIVTIKVAASSKNWSSPSDMVSGNKAHVTCESIDTGYLGQVQISCFFGVLSANPAQCAARPCNQGDNVAVTLDGTTTTIALASTIKSGFSATVGCGDVNPAWSNSVTLSCLLGVVSFDISGCKQACPASTTKTVTLGGDTSVSLGLLSKLDDGATEYNRLCSQLDAGFEGTFSVKCNSGSLEENLEDCTERGCTTAQSVSVTLSSSTVSLKPDIDVLSGGSLGALCEDVHDKYTGLVVLNCRRGALTADSSGCSQRPCEPWDFSVTTVHGVSGLVFPRDSIPSGGSGVAECNGANPDYSGPLSVQCTAAQMSVLSAADCKLTCAANGLSVPGRSVNVEVDGATYPVSPAERIFHGATGVTPCKNALYGYSGDLTLACTDGVLSAASVDCKPDPCYFSLKQNISVAGRWGISSPRKSIPNNATGFADCNANPLLTGDMLVYCFAAKMTVLDESTCKKSCLPESSSATFEILDGLNVAATTPAIIAHGTEGTQLCSIARPGFSGSITLGCEDGVMEVTNHTCVPDPCEGPMVEGDNGTMVPSTLSHGYTWYVPCTTVSYDLIGDVTMKCFAGQIVSNSSKCKGPCDTSAGVSQALPDHDGQSSGDVGNGAAKMYHNAHYTRPCSVISPNYDGTMNISCNLGDMTIDTSTCALACLTSTEASVLTSAGATVTVSPLARLSSGNSESGKCEAYIGDSYSGSMTLTCNGGNVGVTQTCRVACPAGGASITVSAANRPDVTLSAQAKIDHGAVETHQCGDHFVNYSGTFTIACNDGTVSLGSNGCFPSPCTTAQHQMLPVFEDSVLFTPPGNSVNHGATYNRACDTMGPLYSGGSVAVSCAYSVLSPDPSQCAKACTPTSTTATVTGKGWTEEARLLARLEDGATETVRKCADVFGDAIFSGYMTAECSRGHARVPVHTCGRGCKKMETAEVNLTTGLYQVAPDGDDMAYMEVREQPCAANALGYLGNMTLTCDDGVIVVSDEENCEPMPCDAAGSALAVVNGSSKVFTSSGPMAHGDELSFFCADVNPNYENNITVACHLGTLRADTSACAVPPPVPCAAGLLATVKLGNATAQLAVPAGELAHGAKAELKCADAEWHHDGQLFLTCRYGILTADTAGCQRVDRGCPVQGRGATNASVDLNGTLHVLTAAAQMPSGTSASVACGSLNAGFAGNILLSCVKEQLIAEPACYPAPCPSNSIAEVVANGQVGKLMTDKELQSGGSMKRLCFDAHSSLEGVANLMCSYGRLSIAPPACDSRCLAGSRAPALVFGQVSWATLPVSIADGKGIWVECSSLRAGLQGDALLSCDAANVAVDSAKCAPRSCAAGLAANVSIGGRKTSVPLKSEIAHGGFESFECSTVNSDFSGSGELRCHEGVLRADLGGCSCTKASCGECSAGDAYALMLGSWNNEFGVPAANLQVALKDKASAKVACATAVRAGFAGEMKVTCVSGVLRANASACQPGPCVPSGAGLPHPVAVGLMSGGARAPTATASGARFELNCSAVNSWYRGSMTGVCHNTQVIIDAGEPGRCWPAVGPTQQPTQMPTTPAPRAADFCGQYVEVVVGASSYAISLTTVLPYGSGTTVPCGTFDPAYNGTVAVSCSKQGTISGNASACRLSADVEVEEVTVIKSGISFGLPPGLQNQAIEDVQAAMETPSAKAAYAATLSTSLGVDLSSVTIIAVNISRATARRLSAENEGRLLAAGDLIVNVVYQVVVRSDPNDANAPTAASITSKIMDTADASSDAGKLFTQSLGTELEKAAAAEGAGSLLSTIAATVKAEGVVVKEVITPVVQVITVPVTTTTTTADLSVPVPEGEADARSSGMLAMNVLAAVGGVCCAALCGLIVWKVLNRKRSTYVTETGFLAPNPGDLQQATGDWDISPQGSPNSGGAKVAWMPSEFGGAAPGPPSQATNLRYLADQPPVLPVQGAAAAP
eukprot:TRINITY_DN17388_c0_g3_i1.p1 TRINITY_DN17388_c0_g3~~TRINITY_DN17388_c0_g3_i1.p1  ORF type:complete len:4123 (+),score=973.55 TRINITY_DN17388_c0_g3_i1:156-12371(+)